MMTEKTKWILQIMINGGCISFGYRVLDSDRNPITKISEKQFRKSKHLFRKSGIVYVINKSKVRQQHGNSFIKQLYKNGKKIHQ